MGWRLAVWAASCRIPRTHESEAPAAAALEADLEQPGLGELVEVVGGQLPGDADRGNRLVTPQALLAAGDAPVQGQTHRRGEAGQRVEPPLEVETVHGRHSKGNNS
jgi:hypothetical protein